MKTRPRLRQSKGVGGDMEWDVAQASPRIPGQHLYLKTKRNLNFGWNVELKAGPELF